MKKIFGKNSKEAKYNSEEDEEDRKNSDDNIIQKKKGKNNKSNTESSDEDTERMNHDKLDNEEEIKNIIIQSKFINLKKR